MGSHNSFTNYPNVFCFIFLLQLFFGNIPLNFKNYVRPAGIRDDHTNPQMRSIVLSSKHVSLWQRKRDSRSYNDILDFNSNIPNHNFDFAPTPVPISAGGVEMYIDETINYTVIERTYIK